MVSQAGTGGVRPFLQLLEVQALRGAADRELLGRVAAADEAAFRVVAERHGPMVFGVCARLLGNRHDAEDALQATFLVLARRAAAVRKSESLASWLHGVARRVALRLRRDDRRRLAREKAAAAPDVHAPADALAWAEVRAGLDEELTRLPAAYRDVLVLCYLEGLSRDEAGQRLGLDAGAVKGRLERGRRLLGERLVRRGIGLSAGLAALAVAPEATAALRLGRLAADPAAASPRAAALSHEFLKGVAMSKFKFLTAGVAGVLVLAVGVGTAQQPARPPAVTVPSPKADGGTVQLGGTKTLADPAADTDEAFIRRVSLDLRGREPSFAELHFFVTSKDANKRSTLVDLFVKERTAKDVGRAAKTGVPIEELARADAEKAAALQAAERAAWAERMAKQGYLSAAQAEAERLRANVAREAAARAAAEKGAAEKDAQLRRAAEQVALAERAARDAAEAQLRDAERALEAARAAELLAREAAKLKAKDARPPADPARPADPRPTEAKKAPAAPGVPPPLTTGGSRNTVPVAPAPVPPPAAPAVNVEVLKVRVQLAEVTVREKTLLARQTEEQVKRGVVPAGELDRVRLEVERAQLQLREAQLTLEQAERGAPRAVPPATRP